MAYRGEVDPMLMDGVRAPGRLFVFDDGWVFLSVSSGAPPRRSFGRVLAGGAGAAGGALAGAAGGLRIAREIKAVSQEMEAEADRLTAQQVAERYANAVLMPLEEVVSARVEKERWKARRLVVATRDGDEQVLKFGHRSRIFELLPPLLGGSWEDTTA